MRGAGAFFAQFPHGNPLVGGFGLVAEVDGTVVGFALVSIHSVAATMVASIERVFVTRRARRVGIGDALIAATRREASQRGCTQLDALALPGDRDTKNLFERNGLTARLIVASTQL
jgi:GNAT superfamily N-acetyltransferase